MFSATIPFLMNLTTFILVILCVLAGQDPGYLQNYALLQVNVTGLKDAYNNNTRAASSSFDLPIH